MLILLTLIWLAFLLIPQPAVADESQPALGAGWYLADGVATHPPLRALGPKHSDVVFSTRFKRDNAVETAKSFGATRVEWVYASEQDREFLLQLKSSAGWVGGTLNSNVKTPNDEGVAQDFDGNQLIAPWMKTWGAKWVTTTNPLTRKALFDWASSYVSAGADSIQFDGQALQLHSAYWGGDFSPTSLSGFREFLQHYPDKKKLASLGIQDLDGFDYKEYLRKVHGIRNNTDYLRNHRSLPTTPLWAQYLTESVSEFFRELRQHLDITAGHHFPLSMNLTLIDRPSEANQDFLLAEFVDYVIAETPINDEADLHARVATFRALGIGYIPSTAPSSVAEGRKAISTLYALGAVPLIPWDVYVGTGPDGKPTRYFGKVEEYGDLYHFVRQNPQLFDGWEAAPVVGIVIPIDKYREADTMRLVRRLVSNRVPFAFVLTGGSEIKYTLDERRLKRFGVPITTTPPSDFSQKDRDILRSIKLSKLDAEETSETAINNLSPFFRTSNTDNLKLIPRGHEAQDRMDELVIHVIAEHGQTVVDESPCTRSIGIKSSVLAGKRPQKVTWYGMNAASKEAKWDKVAQGFRIELPSCSAWGIAHIELTH